MSKSKVNTKEEKAAQIKLLYDIAYIRPSQWRMGQAVFNYATSFFPETEQLRGSEYDCFYNDDKVDKFIDKLIELETKDLKSIKDETR